MSTAERIPTLDLADETWRSRFIRASEATTAGERKRLALLAANGSLVRIRRGVYLSRPDGHVSRAGDRLLDAVHAYHLEHPDAVFTHRSAAAVWHLPRIGEWPSDVEILGPPDGGGRARGGMIRRRESVPGARTAVGGVPVTSLARTALDLARIDPVTSAVASVDAALRGIRATDGRVFRADPEALRMLLQLFPSTRGVARAAWVLDFADARAELPGESLSRVQMHRLGLTPPELQVPFWDDEGLMEPDFFWPDFGVVGEFDGLGKYLLRAPDPTASAVESVLVEQRREDRLRRQPRVRTVVRWGWRIAEDRAALGTLLRRAGVR